MYEVFAANGAHAVVAVELRHWLSRWWLSWLCRRRLELLHWSCPSLWHILIGTPLSSKGLTFTFDVELQVVEHVHVALLRVVEP